MAAAIGQPNKNHSPLQKKQPKHRAVVVGLNPNPHLYAIDASAVPSFIPFVPFFSPIIPTPPFEPSARADYIQAWAPPPSGKTRSHGMHYEQFGALPPLLLPC